MLRKWRMAGVAWFASAAAIMSNPASAKAVAIAPVAEGIVAAAADVLVSWVVLPAPNRGEKLRLRVLAPTTGHNLPVVIFAHGNRLSAEDYNPLVRFWAAHGFVVIQPTFLDSETLHLRRDDQRTPRIWRFRVEDMKRVLDGLATIEASVAGLKGRLDPNRIAAAGHSYGGITTAMLLGARVIGAEGKKENMSDARIKVGVLLSTAGRGGNDLSAFAAEHFPFMNPSFAEMTTPALVIAGDKDVSRLTIRGPDWFTDAYHLSSGEKCLVTLFGAEHDLGGISGVGLSRGSTDQNPERIAEVRWLSWAYLRSALYPGDPAWTVASAALATRSDPPGRIECK